ncbi:hypothetical protein [Pyrodictium abyssi]|uniref:Uncharacterized protein n=1 Tax=Pyrodictium abyssi TaxID=54256 RepID=A0ABN6ZQ66_9CREN|nr:hypothetical protein PABY_19580 [Pyrodictium abyssi]
MPRHHYGAARQAPGAPSLIKDLAEERKKLEDEIEKLRDEKRLEEKVNATLAELEEPRARLDGLRGAVNATTACSGGSGLPGLRGCGGGEAAPRGRG